MRTIIITLALVFIASSAWSQKKAPEGFVSLFNGKDFTHWCSSGIFLSRNYRVQGFEGSRGQGGVWEEDLGVGSLF